jgi:non-ribosomal peptide synthetase-like protein
MRTHPTTTADTDVVIAQEFAQILAELLNVDGVGQDEHFFDDLGADSMLMAQFCSRVRKRPELPKVSMKDIYGHPTLADLVRLRAAAPSLPVAPAGEPALPLDPFVIPSPAPIPAAPSDGIAGAYADIVAELLGIERVATDAHVFDDLGADSMTMAQFCSRVRRRSDLPAVSMKDIYRYPTPAGLANALRPESTAPVVAPPTATPAPQRRRATRLQYIGCAGAQLVWLLVPFFALAWVSAQAYRVIVPGTGAVETYLRAAAAGALFTTVMYLLPIAAKWLLIGRWKAEEFVAWTPRYLRFWIVKSMVQRNPLLYLMVGSPLYNVYLRMLGARIGPGAAILTRQFPVCTDLFTVGARAVIRKDAVITCYTIDAGVVRTGRVTIGDYAVVGEAAVLDIDTSLGNRAQLGHASSLYPGQSIPDGQRWYGTPAAPGAVDFDRVPGRSGSRLRRARFAISQVVTLMVVTTPVALLVTGWLGTVGERLVGLHGWGRGDLTHGLFYAHAAWAAFVFYFGALLVGLPLLFGISRVLNLFLRPNRVYPLYGFHHTVLRGITRTTNLKTYKGFFGDSSAIVPFLRALGYRLKPYVQTGTNFGTNMTHETPFHVSIGTNTVVADGLSVLNAEYSASSFRITPTRIGANNFLGNGIAYPANGRTGDNCLLATKVMVPIDGELRHDVGLLGSPAFAIPRTVARDTGLAVEDPAALRRGLRAKNRHNLVTVLLHLAVRWFLVFGLIIYAEIAGQLFRGPGWVAVGASDIALFFVVTAYLVAVERFSNRWSTIAPAGVSIYDKKFWRHERYWKVPQRGYEMLFNGTPYKALLLRAVGCRVGRRVLDDGATMPEKNFVTLGDDVTLNIASCVQTHSQEDGAFKSERTTIGAGATLLPLAFVHYGVTVGEHATLGADCFLMKGEDVPPFTYWGGNPAREMDRPAAMITTVMGGTA